MGFKVDTSFLKFLTMGALGSRRIADELHGLGFEPIELERYSASNKIWGTKVKRLRLPDLLCVKTGLRVEVRAKSDLKIKMSDAPTNPERAWDAGLRNDDVIAFIACDSGTGGPVPAQHGVYFPVWALRQSVGTSQLGPAKSASEGAERDRTWPAIVPTRPGSVTAVDVNQLRVRMEGDGEPARNQTYNLNGKTAYVAPGDVFVGKASILAGTPAQKANLNAYLQFHYDPLADLTSTSALDRYAAVKALRFRPDLRAQAEPAVEAMLATEGEIRVALEAAGTAASFGLAAGEQRIDQILHADAVDMSMEAIFILTELQSAFARNLLVSVAGDQTFAGDERRQAAVWGLGKIGHKDYAALLDFLDDAEDDVVLHAVVGLGPDVPDAMINDLINIMLTADSRRAAAASESLRMIGGHLAVQNLAAAHASGSGNVQWALATLGRMNPDLVRSELDGQDILQALEPMLLVAPGGSWLAEEDAASSLTFLHKQNLG
jgi:hypothetical protein